MFELQLRGGPVLARLLELFDPTEDFTGAFEFFDESAARRLKVGVTECVAGNYDTAVHVLAPLVERVVKRIVRDLNLRPVIPADSGGGKSNPGTLGILLAALADPVALCPAGSAALSYILTSDVPPIQCEDGTNRPAIHGLNLRNDVAHGEREEFGFVDALLLLLCLANLARTHSHEGKLALAIIDPIRIMDCLGIPTSGFTTSAGADRATPESGSSEPSGATGAAHCDGSNG